MAIEELVEQFHRDGIGLDRGLFTPEECDRYIDYFMDMNDRGGDGWSEGGVDSNSEDPLRRYPRLLQPHRGDRVAFDFMIDSRLRERLTALCGIEPFAVQTMVYFKPPHSKGQALHQDNRYLRVEPGTCIAAWLALEDCDEENGCMSVVKGSQGMPMLCPVPADSSTSWSGETVPIPPGYEATPMVMKKGDVLFFNGSLIHGSGRNDSDTRFRRIIVGHYIAGEAEKVAKYYFPVYRLDGSEVDSIGLSEGGSPCGVPTTENGELKFKMGMTIEEALTAH